MATTFPSAWDSNVARALRSCAMSLTQRIGGLWPGPASNRQ
jgi:hypothetical protein